MPAAGQWYRAPARVAGDPWLFGQVVAVMGDGHWLEVQPHAILNGSDGGAYRGSLIVSNASGWQFYDSADQALALG